MIRATYDLIAQPWIPVVQLDGSTAKIGLKALLERAHEIREIADPSPLTTFALYRFTLAVVHSVLRGPRDTTEWNRLWKGGHFSQKDLSGYFKKWHDRFDLFHPQHPFLQVADFVTVKGETPVTTPVVRLLLELASGNNATLFDHTTESEPKALPADAAARSLVVAQAWGLGGGQGPTSKSYGKHPYMAHAPCVGAVATLVWRPTVFETLCANLARIGGDVPFCSDSDDRPTWERDEPRRPEPGVPTGYLEFLTWPARHVRLVPDDANGSVADMYFAQGAPLDPDAGYENPFAGLQISPQKGRLPVRLDPERAIWRDSAALFALPSETPHAEAPAAVRFCQRYADKLFGDDSVLSLACFGLANDKAKPLLWRAETISASVRVVRDPEAVTELESALATVESIWRALSDALRLLAYRSLETDTKKPDTAEVSRIQKRLLARLSFWDGVEDGFHEFVRELTPEARSRWTASAGRFARDSLKQAAKFGQGRVGRRDRAFALAMQQLQRDLPQREVITPDA